MRILYLEDNPNDAQLVARYLKTTPHDLMLATDLDQAWQGIEQTPDLVLVDVLLNNSRVGFQFVQALRQQGYNTPVVAVTALTTPQDMAAYQDSGFDDVLAKPFQITELADVIEQYNF